MIAGPLLTVLEQVAQTSSSPPIAPSKPLASPTSQLVLYPSMDSVLAPPPGLRPLEIDISSLSLDGSVFSPAAAPIVMQPEAEPLLDPSQTGGGGSSLSSNSPRPQSPPNAAAAFLPATFLRTICDQLEFYFCDDNLLGDLFLLKNMNMEGYVKLDLLASFGRVKKLTTDLNQLKQSLELSTKLLLSEDGVSVCRKEPLPYDQTYHGKLARTAIAYNLAEDASIASLKETFRTCGEISYLRLLKKNGVTGRNAVLKPPIAAGETYAIIEFIDAEMANHAVLTLSDQYNWRTGMQVVLFDGTTTDKLKQKMFPVEMDRRRAKSASAVFHSKSSLSSLTNPNGGGGGGGAAAPVHVEAVGEGLADLSEGKVSTGIVYSIRGAGGLITPSRQDGSSISFRLVPDDDGQMDIRQGDYVSFTVGKNKKSGRKYASKVKLEFRPPTITPMNVAPTHNVWGGSPSAERERSSGRYEPPQTRNRASTTVDMSRGRSISIGQPRPRLPLKSPDAPSLSALAAQSHESSNSFRQASGPDGTRGFGERRRSDATTPESSSTSNFVQELSGRRRAASSTAAGPPPMMPSSGSFTY
ncbi:Aste57867_1154 [Aphanomyces stellatus]|uniref:Aste57867_1154 protein n=1 Tax=Aphanomyces stellatus TaxID=120398 RepID=A0A485K9L5_9STRA|nr:hypothetical protein As57867_001153 [Aphanomyces stellatus]VFT78374.1 Aste57867_1154 [Aphanomyces stellatus]